jgi:hypothetical protein
VPISHQVGKVCGYGRPSCSPLRGQVPFRLLVVGESMAPTLRGVLAALIVLTGPARLASAEDRANIRPPAALQNAWNERMLAGTSGGILNGVADDRALWHWSGPADTAIVVADLRERSFLKSRGGWVLKGGRLDWALVGEDRIELYGKTIERNEPWFSPWPHVWIGMEVWNFAHEIFLLHRETRGAPARILRTWVIPDAWGGYYDTDPTGSLQRDEGATSVVVKVFASNEAGLFIERVNVSSALRGPARPAH